MSRWSADGRSPAFTHPLTDEEEDRLAAYLLRGESCSVPLALEAMEPPWCDPYRGIQLLGMSWRQLVPTPSSELVDLLNTAQDRPALEPLTTAAEIATFCLSHAVSEQARAPLHELLPDLLLAQAWLDPARLGVDWASYAACRFAMAGGNPQLQLRIGVTALSFLLCASGRLTRGVLSEKQRRALVASGRQDNLENLQRCAARVWQIAGRLATMGGADYPDLPLDLDFGSVVDCSTGVGAPDILAGRIHGSVPDCLEEWAQHEVATFSDEKDPRVVRARDALLADGAPAVHRLRAALDCLSPNAAQLDPPVSYRRMRRSVVAWLGLSGEGSAAQECAALALAEAFSPVLTGDDQGRWMGAALGYLQIAAATSPLALLDGSTSHGVPDLAELARGGALNLIRSAQNQFVDLARRAEWDEADAGDSPLRRLWKAARSVPSAKRDHCLEAARSELQATETDSASLVVIRTLPKSHGSTGREVDRDWRPLVGTPLPLARTPDLRDVYRALVDELPHLRAVVDRLLSDLVGRPTVLLRPTLLVGPPGAGKSYLAQALARSLGLPLVIYPAGGVADASLIGTSRQWSTGRPNVALGLIRTAQMASAMVVVDELEKAGRSEANGRLEDGLLGLWETSTSRNFFDLLLEVPVDLSQVSWIATANSTEGISSPLLDRLRILHVPEPGPGDLPRLLPGALRRIMADRRIPAEWVQPLESWEVAAIEDAWRPRSLRLLRKLAEAVLDARGRGILMH